MSAQTSADLRPSRTHDGEARPRHARVHAEHTGIEHPFAQSRARRGPGNDRTHADGGRRWRPPSTRLRAATAPRSCHIPRPWVTATIAPPGVVVRSFGIAFGKPEPYRIHVPGAPALVTNTPTSVASTSLDPLITRSSAGASGRLPLMSFQFAPPSMDSNTCPTPRTGDPPT